MSRKFLLFSYLILTNVLFAQAQWTTSGNNIVNSNTGSVGIGTGSLAIATQLDVRVTASLGSSSGSTTQITRWGGTTPNYSGLMVSLYRSATGTDWTTATTRLQALTDAVPQGYIDFNPPGTLFGLALGANNVEMMRFVPGGAICIGTATSPSGYLLAVAGSAIFTQAVVKLHASWPDYVFHKDYHLPSLESIAAYIKTNNHLPGMPSAAEVAEKGLDLGATQAKLLEKIEQLTLYTIELQRQADQSRTENERLASLLQAQNEKFAGLQQQIDELKKASR